VAILHPDRRDPKTSLLRKLLKSPPALIACTFNTVTRQQHLQYLLNLWPQGATFASVYVAAKRAIGIVYIASDEAAFVTGHILNVFAKVPDLSLSRVWAETSQDSEP
jgi:hypothetical protein